MMKRLTLILALISLLSTLNACVPYPQPIMHSGTYYNNAPYNAYGGYYNSQPYGTIGVGPRFYGGYRGYGRR